MLLTQNIYINGPKRSLYILQENYGKITIFYTSKQQINNKNNINNNFNNNSNNNSNDKSSNNINNNKKMNSKGLF